MTRLDYQTISILQRYIYLYERLYGNRLTDHQEILHINSFFHGEDIPHSRFYNYQCLPRRLKKPVRGFSIRNILEVGVVWITYIFSSTSQRISTKLYQ